ncbi:MAG TPA: putative Ig domain-containing protein [Candidatus Acidoferrales bacterium]|nr:putative Ig domain-containing protein [Candidatus Acidoferrales bacterium]
MKRLICTLALLSIWLALPTVSAAAQSTVAGTGQFTWTVTGFGETGTGTYTCQSGPGTLFPPCQIVDDTTHVPPQLGVAFTMTIPTVGPKTSVTCTLTSGTLPSWMTLKSSGINCVLTGTPTTTGAGTSIALSFTGS